MSFIKKFIAEVKAMTSADSESAGISNFGDVAVLIEDIQLFVDLAAASIGSYSLRKGASSFLANTPGGPGIIPIVHRMDQTICDPQKVYLLELETGDNLCGRVLRGYAVTDPEFMRLPAHFKAGSTITSICHSFISGFCT
jgi:hypothetical protein